MNKNVKKIINTTISGVLVMGMVLCNSSFIEAKKIKKQESVYVSASADGSIKDVTVSERLENSKDFSGALKDKTNLKDIVNVKGDEKFEQSGDDITWNTSGKDIFYQGKTEEKLPVSIKITYELDGKKVDPNTIIGKSGDIKIHVKYTNKSKHIEKINGEDVEIYTPFVMLTGFILKEENFTNVKIDNGKVINDGTKSIVVGTAVPGLKESLQLDELDMDTDKLQKNLTDEFTVTAKTTNFKMGNTYSYVGASFFDNIDIDSSDPLKDIDEKIDDIKDATGKLIDGSSELVDGTDTLYDGVTEFTDKLKQYKNEGIKKLTNGIYTMDKKKGKLKKGIKKYANGVTKFADGTKGYVDGATKIADGNVQLYKAVKGLPDQVDQFAKGVNDYTAGVDKLADEKTAAALKKGSKDIAGGIGAVNKNVGDLKGLSGKEKQLVEALVNAAENDPSLAAYKEYIGQLKQIHDGEEAYISGIYAATDKDSDLQKGANQVSAGVSQVLDGAATISKNSKDLRTAASTMKEKMPELTKNVKLLSDGSSQLTSNNKKLVSASKTLKKSSGDVKKTINTLSKGIGTLAKGGKKLDGLTDKLYEGAVSIKNGSKKLKNGMGKLDDGINEFNDKAIEKIIDTIDNKARPLADKLKAVLNAGKDYNSFAGSAKGMDGEVKFIIETEPIEGEED